MKRKKAANPKGTQPPCGSLFKTAVKYTPSMDPKIVRKSNTRGHGRFHITSITRVINSVEINITPSTATPGHIQSSSGQTGYSSVQYTHRCNAFTIWLKKKWYQRARKDLVNLTKGVPDPCCIVESKDHCHAENHEHIIDFWWINLTFLIRRSVHHLDTGETPQCYSLLHNWECCCDERLASHNCSECGQNKQGPVYCLWDWLEESVPMIHGMPDEVRSLAGICEETWWVQNSCESNLVTGRQRIHVVSWKWSLNSRSFLGINYCIEM